MKDCSNRGKLMVMIGLLVIAPVAILPFYPQDIGYAIYFLLTGLLSILAGGLVCAFGKREAYFSSDRLTAQRHSNNTVLFTCSGNRRSCRCLLLLGLVRVVQSLFESVMAGPPRASVMDVTQTSKIFLFSGAQQTAEVLLCADDGDAGFRERSMDLFNARATRQANAEPQANRPDHF